MQQVISQGLSHATKHLGQFESKSPKMLQASFSSRAGHWLPPPIGICVMIRVRTRKPGERSAERQVLEQGLHDDQSDVWQGLGITQDWKVREGLLLVHRLCSEEKTEM